MDEAARRTRRAFLTLAGAGAAAGLGWNWMWSQPADNELPAPVRRILDFNGELARRALYRPAHLAPEFGPGRVRPLRVNGDVGLAGEPPAEVIVAGTRIPIGEIRKLPKTSHVTELKCIEGWSTVTQFAGVRFSTFLDAFAPEAKTADYASLTTPDKEYFVGVDLESMLHPQTLLAWEHDGQPLTPAHGAPLRLVIPVKYGIKNIKRIGTITFSGQRPPDYWAQDGYDYYAGL